MKALINDSFKAIRTGEFITAAEDAGEFIFDSESKLPSVATMLEIGKGNNIPLRKEKASIVAENLANGLTNLGLPTMDKKADSEIVRDIVVAGVEKEKSDDDMLLEIMQAGIKFKVAGKLFNKAMQEGGFKITASARKEQARKHLVEVEFNPTTYEQVTDMVDQLTKVISDTTTSQAHSCVKAYLKELEVEMPQAPKVPTGGLRNKIMDWICENPSCDKAQLLKSILELSDGKKGDEKLAERFYRFVEFGKKYAKAIATVEQETVEA